jgi:hypothetical protein
MVTGGFSPEVKRPGRKADHSPSSSGYTSISLYISMAWYLDNFIFPPLSTSPLQYVFSLLLDHFIFIGLLTLPHTPPLTSPPLQGGPRTASSSYRSQSISSIPYITDHSLHERLSLQLLTTEAAGSSERLVPICQCIVGPANQGGCITLCVGNLADEKF